MVDEDSQENGSLYDGMSLTNANASWRKLMRLMTQAFSQSFSNEIGLPGFSRASQIVSGYSRLKQTPQIFAG
ncbi:Hypothetical predicted protein, partial [Paramuricea clavata]